MNRLKFFSIIGGGSWGTAIASYLCSIGKNVKLYTPVMNVVEEINQSHTNSEYLGDIKLPQDLVATNNMQDIVSSDYIVIAVPSYVFGDAISQIKSLDISSATALLIATKGLSNNPVEFLSDKVKRELPNIRFAFLSGPNFAKEVAKGYPTTGTISAENMDFAKYVVFEITSDNFVFNASDDVITTQIAGVVKNIIAIKSGIMQASDAGENAIASTITAGLKEIAIIAKSFGGKQDTLLYPGVIGDLMLTCYSSNSRNTKFGYDFHQNNYSAEFLRNYPTLVEGAEAAKLITKIIDKKLNTPIIDSIAQLVK